VRTGGAGEAEPVIDQGHAELAGRDEPRGLQTGLHDQFGSPLLGQLHDPVHQHGRHQGHPGQHLPHVAEPLGDALAQLVRDVGHAGTHQRPQVEAGRDVYDGESCVTGHQAGVRRGDQDFVAGRA
jgi:hypothetical protein